MKKLIYKTLALLLTFSIVFVSCEDDRPEPPGSIHGIVSDHNTQRPIQGVTVRVDERHMSVTGSDGRYEILNLPPGEFFLTASHPEYQERRTERVILNSGEQLQFSFSMERIPPALQLMNLDHPPVRIDSFAFGSEVGFVSDVFNIFNSGTESLNWQTVNSSEWISNIDVMSGTLRPGELQPVRITIDREKLNEGRNMYLLSVTSNRGSGRLTITATRPQAVPPSVTTQPVSVNLAAGTAVFNGTITNVGDPAHTQRGFVFGTTPNPTITSTVVPASGIGPGPFSSAAVSVPSGETFYVRAFARVGDQYPEYGNQVTFSTTEVSPYILLPGTNILVQSSDLGTMTWGTAQTACDISVISGYTDWRLPTRTELNLMYTHRSVIGGFTTAWYWSSTPAGGGWHWAVNFNPATTPRERDHGPSSSLRVRCVRTAGAQTAKNVSVGTQIGTLTAGTAGTVTFPVTTTNIANGAYTATVTNLPSGISVQGNVTINNNVGTLTLVGNAFTNAGTFNNLQLTIDGTQSSPFPLTISPPAARTVSVGSQIGTLIAGTAGTVTFPITTTNIANGAYTATVTNLPWTVSIQGQVTINNGIGTLTLAGNILTTAGTHSNLRLTIDGTQSLPFTLTISQVVAPTVAQVRFRKEITDAMLTQMALDDANNNELAHFVFGAAPSTSGWFNVPPGNHFPFFLDEFYLNDLHGGWRVLLPAPHSHNFVAGRRYTIVLSSHVESSGRVIDEGTIPASAPIASPPNVSRSPNQERERPVRSITPANTNTRQRIDTR